METVRALLVSWRSEADTLRKRYGDERCARLCDVHAEELERALHDVTAAALTVQQAAEESGYSVQHIRRLIGAGALENVGRRGAPRVRRGDLPAKAKTQVTPKHEQRLAGRRRSARASAARFAARVVGGRESRTACGNS